MAFNQYLEGVITASLGTLLILFGLPYLSSIPRVGKNTPKKQALLTLFNYFQFFLSCVLLGATITIRVLIHHFDVDFNTAYIAAAIPVGALVALIGLLFFRFLMLAYGLFVGMLLGMLLEAGLHNIFDTQDEHAWGKLITLTVGLLFAGVAVSRSPSGWFIRLVFALSGAALLAMSPSCWSALPSDMRRKALIPWVKFIPETADAECSELATPEDQTDVYVFWGIMAALVAIPMLLFVLIPWINRKLHCTAFSQDGFGLRIRFRPDREEREKKRLLKKSKKNKNKGADTVSKSDSESNDGDSVVVDDVNGDYDDDDDGEYLDDSEERTAGLSGSYASVDDDDSSAGATQRMRIAEDKLREEDRIEVLHNKFDMFNKQREWLLRDEVAEEEEKRKPPPGVIDWKRGTPDKVVPAVKILATRVLGLFIAAWGMFWLVWLIGWGRNWDTFVAVISWFAYVVAETVNYVLGIIYNLNFWTPTVRKRKSLYALEGFVETVDRVRVDSLIFHYKEDPNTTQKTLEGCLLMKRLPNVHLTHRICDDSFGQKRSDTVRKLILAELEARGEQPAKPGAKAKSAKALAWLKRKAQWCMGGKRCPLPCSLACCSGKAKEQKKNKKKDDSATDGADGEEGKKVEDEVDEFFDESSYYDEEDDFGENYTDNTITQADIDSYPFPEFDPLFYPLPEALQALQDEARKRGAGTKTSSSSSSSDVEATENDGEEMDVISETSSVDDAKKPYSFGFHDDVEKLAAEAGGLYDKMGCLLEPMSDRERKIYEKNRRILKHLGLGKDFNGIPYDFEPSDIGREVVYRVMEVVEVYLGGAVIPVLHFKEEMFREDCARGSLSVTFELRNPEKKKKQALSRQERERTIEVIYGEDEAGQGYGDDDDEIHHKSPKMWGGYPDMSFDDETMPKDRVKIVARIKPNVHHNKAGNINNVLYNTEVREKGQYLIFLDNDMRPEPDFLLYTLPWFYNEGQLARHWEINDNLSFVQTPQIFVRDAIRDGDKLGNGNQVFFAAIQPGRDGENACAFAGTNAIFAKRALLRIGGVPYESQTEDAHTSIRLHRDGFVSYYVNLPLVVGEAPTTVASRLLQYLRWVKGSIQLWWAQFYEPPAKMCIGQAPKRLPKDQRPSKFMLTFYAIDTMTWPLSAISALLYMFCALVFVFFAEPPLQPHDPFDISSFLWVFLPYLCLRMANNLIALQGVKSSSVWVAQEVWYAQAFTAFLGILDALYEKFLGTGLTGWKVTGEGTRTTAIEYFNVVVSMLLLFGVIIRLIVFLADGNDRLISFGSAFFAGVILVQLWPMVSMSLYELLINEYKPAEEKKELGRFKIPNWLSFTALLCIGISAGVLFA